MVNNTFDLTKLQSQSAPDAPAPAQDPLLRALWEGVDYGIFILEVIDDGTGFQFVRLNPVMAQMSRVPAAALIGKTLQDALPSQVAHIYHQHCLKAISTGKTMQFEEQLEVNGQLSWCQVGVTPLRSQHQQINQLVVTLIDISDRKQTDGHIYQAKQILQQVVDSIPFAIFWKDRDSVYQGCNLQFSNIAGFDHPSQLMGKTDYDMPWQREESDWFRVCDRRVMDSNTPDLHIIEPQLQADGKQAWLSTSKIPIHDKTGQVNGILGVIEDITERKRMEDELQRSQTHLKAVIDNAPAAIFIKDLEGRYTLINSEIERIFQMTAADWLGKTDQAIMPPEIAQDIQTNDAIVIKNCQPLRAEETIVIDGETRHYVAAKFPLVDCEGRVFGLGGMSIDITEQKQAEGALQEYGDRQALLNQLTTQIRNSLDVDTILNTAIRALSQLLALDWCAFAWFDPTTEPAIWQVVQEVHAEEAKSLLGEYSAAKIGPIAQVLMAEGILWINDVDEYAEPIHRQFLQSNGVKSRIMATIQTELTQVGIIICDMQHQQHAWTESEIELVEAVAAQLAIAIEQAQLYHQSRQQAQELTLTLRQLQRTQAQMLQSEKMSSLGQLVAGVAHEINNPVSFIHGNLKPARQHAQDLMHLIEVYQQVYPQPNKVIQAEMKAVDLAFVQQDFPRLLDSMHMGTQRIREIVLSLRNFSRLDETGVKAVDLHQGINSTLVVLGNRLKAKAEMPDITILKEYDQLPLVECDPGQLNQVFMNILTNAIDALEEKYRKLSAREDREAPCITIRTASHLPNSVRITIADNGLGMPETVKNQVFNPFYTTKPVGQGTGMGMSISYQIITDKHGGTISCQSMPNQGTAFMIDMPVQQSQAQG